MSKTRIFSYAPTVSLVCAMVVAGCTTQSAAPPSPQIANQPAPVAPSVAAANPQNQASALNGRWLPTDGAGKGVYVAEFRDGVFVSRSTSTKQPLAKGSYKVPDDTKVSLDFVGAATQTAVSADCVRRTPETMYCVPSVGSPFNLRKA